MSDTDEGSVGETTPAIWIAIDIGASTVALATIEHQATMPAVVAVDGARLVAGPAAAAIAASDPGRASRELGRRIGDDVPVMLGDAAFGLADVVAHVMREAAVSVDVDPATAGAIVMHPASWRAHRVEQLLTAAHLAGFAVCRAEPLALAAAHCVVAAGAASLGDLVAVHDLGGGSFEAALVALDPTGPRLVGTPMGIERTGGTELDHAVLRHVVASIGGLPDGLDSDDAVHRAALAVLRDRCAAAKETLSSDPDATVRIDLPGIDTTVRITRPELEAHVRPLVDADALVPWDGTVGHDHGLDAPDAPDARDAPDEALEAASPGALVTASPTDGRAPDASPLEIEPPRDLDETSLVRSDVGDPAGPSFAEDLANDITPDRPDGLDFSL